MHTAMVSAAVPPDFSGADDEFLFSDAGDGSPSFSECVFDWDAIGATEDPVRSTHILA